MSNLRPANCRSAVVLVGLLFTACVICCIGIYMAAVLVDANLETYPRSTAYTSVAVSATSGSESLEDWYAMAVQLLAEHGWNSQSDLQRLNGNARRRIPYAPQQIKFEFAIIDRTTLFPHLKRAYVDFRFFDKSAQVSIEDSGPRRTDSNPISLRDQVIGFRQAMEMAEMSGGEDLRSERHDECSIIFSFANDVWTIGYIYTDESGQANPRLRVRVDAKSGEVVEVSRH